jgi:hypothetical protein
LPSRAYRIIVSGIKSLSIRSNPRPDEVIQQWTI